MTDLRYKIRDKANYQYVQAISVTGDVINSTVGTIFNDYNSAISYLLSWQDTCIQNNRYLNLDRFIIEELHLVVGRTIPMNDVVQPALMSEPIDDTKLKWLRCVLTQSVLDGFNIIKPELLQFILSSDKYESTLSEVVPPHMIQCIDEFNNVGILKCDLDLLGSISLTATEKQLTMYDIDGLLKRRTNNTSK